MMMMMMMMIMMMMEGCFLTPVRKQQSVDSSSILPTPVTPLEINERRGLAVWVREEGLGSDVGVVSRETRVHRCYFD
ncbi:hypothetical protein EYF80_065415 [Liparis tanakae]|uniref:Secreted protein n=1 Tax=Liparis tanakae TaxID=230148 RepID=A0A4Z2E6S1_9TELE|nr:hypothetical protein EYF80_065415 [Liparis tanakae]